MSVLTQRPQRFSARYGARHPWLAPWPRAGLYLVWRGVVAAFRPFVFLGLIAVAVVSAVFAAQELPRPQTTTLSLSARIDQALYDALEPTGDRHQQWVVLLDRALQASPRTMPDIVQARSIATSYVAMRGPESLGLELLSEGRNPRLIEAELRALPAWQRRERLDDAIADQLLIGAEQGFQPAALVFAPAILQNRLGRAEQLYAPTFVEAERWFVEPGARALALDALPGLNPDVARIYDDVRDLVVQTCAVAMQLGRGGGQCRVGFLPKPQADPVMAGLTLGVVGAEPERRAGARLAKAAWAAEQLHPELAEALAFGPDVELGLAATLASAMPLMVDAGEVWTQPNRFEGAARAASREAALAAGMDQRWRDRVYDSLTALRREVGALAALRLLDTVATVEEAETLVRIAEASEGQLLALHTLVGPELIARIEDQRPPRSRVRSLLEWPERAHRYSALSVLALLAAFAVLAISLWGGWKRKQGRPPGPLERFDAAVSRLILGRNL